jgi:hypothetical protein
VPKPGTEGADDAGSLVNTGEENFSGVLRRMECMALLPALASIYAIDLSKRQAIDPDTENVEDPGCWKCLWQADLKALECPS